MKYLLNFLILSLFLVSCKSTEESNSDSNAKLTPIYKAKSEIQINGNGEDAAWANAEWREIDQLWAGTKPSKEDFYGRYKVVWSPKMLYVLTEITDDKISDTHEDGLINYWDDDCLELFIDENNSNGDHQYNHSAFAYHIATNMRVTDMGRDGNPLYLDHHVQSAKVTNSSNITTWEVGIRIYTEGNEFTPNTRILKTGNEIGFSVAYCDNDASEEREHFMGSNPISGKDKNRGWIDAGVFKNWVLEE